LNPARIVDPQNSSDVSLRAAQPERSTSSNADVICPVCGAIAVHEKCKVICRSDKCRGRVVMNCSEF
jgi:hypothetical protein